MGIAIGGVGNRRAVYGEEGEMERREKGETRVEGRERVLSKSVHSRPTGIHLAEWRPLSNPVEIDRLIPYLNT